MGNSVTEPVTQRHDPDCVFCRIIAGEIPSERVHVRVVPREHRRDVTELAEDPALLAHTATVAAKVAAEQADGDFRLVFNTGASAGQSVFHVHAHVLEGGKLAEGEL